ncbi:MAG: ATP-binding protein [bacterium]
MGPKSLSIVAYPPLQNSSFPSDESVLSRSRSFSLTPTQAWVDRLVGQTMEEAVDVKTLAAAAGAGMVYRITRIASAAWGASLFGKSPFLVRTVSVGAGLAGESAAFAGVERGFVFLEGKSTSESFTKEWLKTSVSLGSLKFFGKLGEKQNFLLQNLMADTGMVASHELAFLMRLEEKPQEDLFTRLLRAEVMNRQMSAGMGLLHGFAPALVGAERSLDLFLKASEGNFSSRRSRLDSLFTSPLWAMAMGAFPASTETKGSFALLSEGGEGVRFTEGTTTPVSLKIVEGEFPFEEGKKGLLVEVSPEAMEETVRFAKEYLEEKKWDGKDETLSQYPVRFFVSPGFAADLYEKVHGLYKDFLDDLRPSLERALQLGERIRERGDATEEEKREILEIRSSFDARYSLFLRQLGVLHFMNYCHTRFDLDPHSLRLEKGLLAHDINGFFSFQRSYLQMLFVTLHRGQVVDKYYQWGLDLVSHSDKFKFLSLLKQGIHMSSAPLRVQWELESQIHKEIPLSLFDFHGNNRDGLRLGRILMNLVDNAWRYRRSEDPQLRFTVRYFREGVEFTLEDDGVGIAPEALPKLGQFGFREGRKEVEGSHGHGLTSVIQMLRELGWGPLWVKSEEGRGSRFRFYVPFSFLRFKEGQSAETPPPDPREIRRVNEEEGFIIPEAAREGKE